MNDHQPLPACASESCSGDCPKVALTRRTFLALSATGLGAAALNPGRAAAQPTPVTPPTRAKLAALVERGAPTEYSGTALPRIGMPVGGGCTGQVFLAGDGRLWAWDIFNPLSFPLGGADFAGSNYANPLSADKPGALRFDQGFAVRTTSAGSTRTVRLDSSGFSDVRFVGQYPIGGVRYADPQSPINVDLEAFAPFIPGEVDDSTLPTTIMSLTLRNTSAASVEVDLLGHAANPVCLDSRSSQPTGLRVSGNDRGIEFTAFDDRSAESEDIGFEDWESEDFGEWTVSGDAFGDGPVTAGEMPDDFKRFGDLNLSGTRFVTSFRGGGEETSDDATGTLTSKEFTVERRYVAAGLGGGDRGDQACLQVIIDGSVVASATGSNSEPIVTRFLDLEAHRGKEATLVIKDDARGAWGHLNCDAIWFTDREDTLFENWDQGFQGWTTTGTAFGKGPVTAAETPEDFRRPVGIRTDLNVQGNFATSFNFRGNGDGEQGTLTSAEFTIDRRFVTAWVGGGSHREQTCLNVIIGDDVVATATGTDIEPVTAISMDVGRHRGKKARIQIVDAHTGGWGHINVDRIIFSDRPVRRLPVARRPDGGSFALGLLDREASDVAVTVRPSITAADTPDGLFDGPEAPLEVDGATPQVGTVSTRFTLAAREDRTVRFAFGWFFPTLRPEHFTQLVDGAKLRREYVNRFDSARAVVDHVATEVERLTAATRAWVTAWYEDSTLPHWFLERTLATAATLATSTCYRFDKGRFYAWEGTYCCTGTCQHVWNYAQAIGRLFPALERDTRERVDLGVAFRENGEMGNRGEGGDLTRDAYADGQCGTILRFYREHQMSPDKRFLERNWTKIKKSVEFVVDQFDGAEGDAIDGILRGSQWNTLDGAWFGEIPWLSGLYIASLRAAAAMAGEIGDDAAVQRWTTVAEQGSAFLSSQLFNPDYGYFVHRVDPVRKGAANTNRGCHIDQMYGQTYASQLGLPRVFDQDQSRTALGKLYANNFLTDPGSYRPPGIGPSRVFATKDEPGVIMTTWPYGGSDESGGHGYFNEVWTGQEHQFAAHLFAEGLTAEGLAVTKAIHDRHHGSKRNPYNEIEASDHYARAMMGFGVYLAAIGYEYHGPKGHLGFAPRIGPEDFRGAFTAAEGWGSYRQTRGAGQLKAEIEVRYGKLRLVTLAFQTDGPAQAVTVTHQGQPVPAELKADGSRSLVTLGSPMVIASGASLKVELT